MTDEEITAGMKMFDDIKPDYYVDDNYRFYSYDEYSDDALEEYYECEVCGADMEEGCDCFSSPCIHGIPVNQTCSKCET